MSITQKEKAGGINTDDLISTNNKIIAQKSHFVKGTQKAVLEVLRSIDDTELLTAVLKLAQSRYYLKKPMTALAVKMLLKRLDVIYNNSGDSAIKVATIEKAVACGWQTVYPLSADEIKAMRDKPSYNTEVIKRKINNFD